MLPAERRATFGLASIFVLRMLGLFLLLPVLPLYVDGLPGASPVLIGVALGAYGLTQALLQIPFGMLSDRVGRKPVITAGLLLFALGSVVAALAHGIGGVIFGRALQGAGAIAAAVMALAADVTREGQRLKVMASIGISISLAFGIALVAGPLLDDRIGLSGIFWFSAALALIAILILHLRVPTPLTNRIHHDAEPVRSQFGRVLRTGDLLRLNFGIASLHFALMATFMAVPLLLHNAADLPRAHHWWVYAPALLVSMAVIVPFVIIAERRRLMKQVLLLAVAGLVIAELWLALTPATPWAIAVALFGFFACFNLLEGLLPSLIAKQAPAEAKGTAMGFYSTSQFLGAFLGGVGGGWMVGEFGIRGSFFLAAGVVLIWLLVASRMRPPRHLSSLVLPVAEQDQGTLRVFARRLSGIEGVVEAVVIPEERVAYLKVESDRLDHAALERLQLEHGGSGR
jgi:MFS family permease